MTAYDLIEDLKVLQMVAGTGEWEWLGGGLTTVPDGRDPQQDILHARCVRLATAGYIEGEDYGAYWYWHVPPHTVH